MLKSACMSRVSNATGQGFTPPRERHAPSLPDGAKHAQRRRQVIRLLTLPTKRGCQANDASWTWIAKMLPTQTGLIKDALHLIHNT